MRINDKHIGNEIEIFINTVKIDILGNEAGRGHIESP
jgi:hypothetical protein